MAMDWTDPSGDDATRMRAFMRAAAQLAPAEPVMLTETETAAERAETGPGLLTGLHDVSARLRAHAEADDGEHAFGVELGMQRAAEMIDNLIRRHQPLATRGERQGEDC